MTSQLIITMAPPALALVWNWFCCVQYGRAVSAAKSRMGDGPGIRGVPKLNDGWLSYFFRQRWPGTHLWVDDGSAEVERYRRWTRRYFGSMFLFLAAMAISVVLAIVLKSPTQPAAGAVDSGSPLPASLSVRVEG